MTPQESFDNLPQIMAFAFIGLRIIAIPIGIGVAIIVRRISPAVTSVVLMIFAGYIIGFVVLFFILHYGLLLAWYDAAAISLIVVGGIVFYISYVVKRSLYPSPTSVAIVTVKEDTTFEIFGEPVKGHRKKNRRKHY